MIKAGAIVLLEWDDITDHSDSDWNDTPDALPTSGMKTIGFLASTWKPTHMVVRVCRDISADEGTYHGVRALPAGCINSITNQETGEQWELTGLTFRKVKKG